MALEYAAPYSEWLSGGNSQEPSIEEMKKLVSIDQRRPLLPNRWHSDPVSIVTFSFVIMCHLNSVIAQLQSINSHYRLWRGWEN